MLLMMRKGIRAGICHAIYWYVKANNRCMKNYDKKEESSYLKFWEVNNFYGRAVSQKLPENDAQWVEEASQFNKYFITN